MHSAKKAPSNRAAAGNRTILAGLVGHGIQLSRTPAMHEAEGAALGLRYCYRLFDTQKMGRDPPAIGKILEAAQICGFAGLNITYPFKLEVLDQLDELSEAAEAVGAVNTVVFRDGKRHGHNTDVWGFAESFRQNMSDAARNRVLLIGAGGAGAAVAQALIQHEVVELVVFDRVPGKAGELADRLGARFDHARVLACSNLTRETGLFDGVVNATPVGMNGMPGSACPVELLSPSTWVADIVYFPIETELLRAAREIGCRTLPGSGMAVFQAVRAFELITGLAPNPARMKAAFEAFRN